MSRAEELANELFPEMEEIYDEGVLKEGLEEIENMTVKEIRRGLREGYGFFIFGDSSWAILEADKTKRDIKMAENLSFSFALTVEDIQTILDISFWNEDPEKILEEYNRIKYGNQ